jgi:integrase
MANAGKYRGISIYYETSRNRYRMWFTNDKGLRKPVYGKNKEQVKENYDKIQEALRKRIYLDNVPDTFNKLMKEMLQEQEEDRELKDNSLNRKHDTAKIVSQFMKCSSKPIKNISADELNKELKKLSDIKKFVQSKNKEEYRFSQSYLNKIYSLIKEVFHYAVLKEKLSKELDPFEVEGKVKKPKANKLTKVVKPFTRGECIKFLEQLNKENHEAIDILRIQLFGGLRIGETLRLNF